MNKVTGGPIKEHKYQFLQFHMHWGQGNLLSFGQEALKALFNQVKIHR